MRELTKDERVRNHIFSCLECTEPDDIFGCVEGLDETDDGNEAEYEPAELEDED